MLFTVPVTCFINKHVGTLPHESKVTPAPARGSCVLYQVFASGLFETMECKSVERASKITSTLKYVFIGKYSAKQSHELWYITINRLRGHQTHRVEMVDCSHCSAERLRFRQNWGLLNVQLKVCATSTPAGKQTLLQDASVSVVTLSTVFPFSSPLIPQPWGVSGFMWCSGLCVMLRKWERWLPSEQCRQWWKAKSSCCQLGCTGSTYFLAPQGCHELLSIFSALTCLGLPFWNSLNNQLSNLCPYSQVVHPSRLLLKVL